MKTRTLKTTALRGDAGFTAIEIAMVAAVIAILSLIVLPVFRNRVEEAKVAAAQADLSALMKSEQVVKADIDAYARLEDLDNVQLFGYTTAPPNGIDKEVPAFKYVSPSATVSPDPNSRQVIPNDAQRTLLAYAGTDAHPVWKGPYIAFQRSITLENLRNTTISPVGQYLLRTLNGNSYQAAVQDLGPGDPFRDHDESRIPADPWGNPYMFFPPTGNAANPSLTQAFASSVIYSMGPNGLPGDGSQPNNVACYTREFTLTNSTDPARLGAGDDLMVEF